MGISHYSGAVLFPLLFTAALVVIGIVLGPRAGAGRGRMWVGLGLLIALQIVSGLWTLSFPYLVQSNLASMSATSAVYGVTTGILHVVAIAVLASAATVDRSPQAQYLDPMNPGVPPVTGYQGTGYQGTGYPPGGGESSSPYLNRPPG